MNFFKYKVEVVVKDKTAQQIIPFLFHSKESMIGCSSLISSSLIKQNFTVTRCVYYTSYGFTPLNTPYVVSSDDVKFNSKLDMAHNKMHYRFEAIFQTVTGPVSLPFYFWSDLDAYILNSYISSCASECGLKSVQGASRIKASSDWEPWSMSVFAPSPIAEKLAQLSDAEYLKFLKLPQDTFKEYLELQK